MRPECTPSLSNTVPTATVIFLLSSYRRCPPCTSERLQPPPWQCYREERERARPKTRHVAPLLPNFSPGRRDYFQGWAGIVSAAGFQPRASLESEHRPCDGTVLARSGLLATDSA